MILRTAILKEHSVVPYKDFIYYYLGGFKTKFKSL